MKPRNRLENLKSMTMINLTDSFVDWLRTEALTRGMDRRDFTTQTIQATQNGAVVESILHELCHIALLDGRGFKKNVHQHWKDFICEGIDDVMNDRKSNIEEIDANLTVIRISRTNEFGFDEEEIRYISEVNLLNDVKMPKITNKLLNKRRVIAAEKRVTAYLLRE